MSTGSGAWRDRERAGSRRPISPAELPHLEALGVRLVELRHEAGLSRRVVAERAQVARSTIERIEAGTRRTRRSTLERIAGALGRLDAARELAALAGPALAAESDHAGRVARRRGRRARQARDRAAWEKVRRERDAAWAARAELKAALGASRYVWRQLVR